MKRPAVTNWQRRHTDFPEPIRSGATEYFSLARILAWSKSRTISASARAANEPAGVTYADRIRRNRSAAVAQSPVASTADFGSLDDAETRQLLKKLMGLADKVRGAGSVADYLNLLFSLVLLHGCALNQWSALPHEAQSMASREDAKRLLRRIGSSADDVLRHQGLLLGMHSSLLGLQPRTYQDLADVLRLSSGLGRSAFRLLLDMYQTHLGLKSSEFFTPPSLAQLMARLLLSETSEVQRIYDPYARGGELLAAVAAAATEDLRLGAMRLVVRGESPHRDTLGLAGMNLVLYGLPVHIETSSPTPWNEANWPQRKADLIITNPPFNVSAGAARSRQDHEWPYGPPPRGNDNYAWLQHVLTSLADGGRAAVVMPNNAGVSAHPQERDIRKKMVERGAVECIIALPPQLFPGTSIPVSLWLLKYPAGSCNQMLFIDAGRMGMKSRSQRTLREQDRKAIEVAYRSWRDNRERGFTHLGSEGLSTSIAVARIRDHDYSLNPSDYLPKRVETVRTDAAVPNELADARAEESRLRALASELDDKVDRLNFSSTPGPPDSLPAGWQRTPLHTLCEIQAGPSYSRLRATERSANEGVSVVLPKHISNRRIIAVDHEKVPREVADELSKFQLKAGDILCVRSGTTGSSALVEESQVGQLFSTNLLRLRCRDPDKVDSGYLLGYLSMPDVMEWIKNRSRATTAIPSISTRSLGQISIVLPPLAEQQGIGAALRAFDEQITAHLGLAQAAEHLRATLAEHLLDGDLIVD